uniref:PDZ domain-containing protein n=1 Tax=Chenopodium quinoa TaxID=63459 RepID=A0A803MU66_CHEQI
MEQRISSEKFADASSAMSLRGLVTDFDFEKVFQQIYTDGKFVEVQLECKWLMFCNGCVYFSGLPILVFEWQKMENPDFCMAMGVKSDQNGILATQVEATAPEFEVLKSSDIILSFNGVDIGNDGTGSCCQKELKKLRKHPGVLQRWILKFDLMLNMVVIFRTGTAKAATADFLATRCIPSAMSDDLKT